LPCNTRFVPWNFHKTKGFTVDSQTKLVGLKGIRLIQAGMGVGVSSWKLANKTARHKGVLGTVSGIAAEDILTRTLQQGDPGGHFRRALSAFPYPEIGEWIVERYYVEGGIPPGQKYKAHSVFDLKPSKKLQQLMVAGEFALVWLAKEGHEGLISVNYLEKIQIPHIWYILGAMLAKVDVVTMGAGIITQVPVVLDALAGGSNPVYKVDVESFDGVEAEGNEAKVVEITFNPEELLGGRLPQLVRPELLAIVSGDFLARVLIKKCPGGIQGFVIENPSAGGHNAPPRGRDKKFDELGQPVYAEEVGGKDYADLAKFREFHENLSIPFFLAGSYGSPEGYQKARLAGANGVQVGSAFALSDDSGFLPHLRSEARRLGFLGKLVVLRDANASPTGYPFNVAQMEGTLSDKKVFHERQRICSICALRVVFQHEGKLGYRCASEPIHNYLEKGGKLAKAELAVCLCNALLAAIGLGNPGEMPIMTMGQTLDFLPRLMKNEHDSYTADNVIAYILQESE
jgi:NAD(P)H-dependent flavin oxidoreductase YrpB (nitropropane dioxygenase family)